SELGDDAPEFICTIIVTR
ncbi:hypothetical protein THAOC_31942, partial [Thalassiosira oceanica]